VGGQVAEEAAAGAEEHGDLVQDHLVAARLGQPEAVEHPAIAVAVEVPVEEQAAVTGPVPVPGIAAG